MLRSLAAILLASVAAAQTRVQTSCSQTTFPASGNIAPNGTNSVMAIRVGATGGAAPALVGNVQVRARAGGGAGGGARGGYGCNP